MTMLFTGLATEVVILARLRLQQPYNTILKSLKTRIIEFLILSGLLSHLNVRCAFTDLIGPVPLTVLQLLEADVAPRF
ncbi:hypothetical protein QGP82_07800 [Leptothoe sp. LEGE 181152]|nr:hypothetical protein [Adonisia turfae]MDV3348588.1 hypothetical protein [Leptothoe sp. LEGE 181152]